MIEEVWLGFQLMQWKHGVQDILKMGVIVPQCNGWGCSTYGVWSWRHRQQMDPHMDPFSRAAANRVLHKRTHNKCLVCVIVKCNKSRSGVCPASFSQIKLTRYFPVSGAMIFGAIK